MNITLPEVAAGATASGEMDGSAIAELQKALTAGYGTDVSTLSGGAALRIQSLDKTMMSTIQENQHFRLFNALQKDKAIATVDEWTEQSGVGGFLGGSTNSETGNIAGATGSYARRVGLVKYLMTRREVSFVQTLQGAIADSEAVEAQNGALQLLTDAEYLSFEGDSTVVPTEFDGIKAQITSLGSSDHVLDARGASLASINLVNAAAATIAGYGNFGTPTHIFMSLKNQADFDNNLDPAFRVPLSEVPDGGTKIGAPVVGIRTSHGNIANMPDVFIRDENMKVPFETQFGSIAAANNFAPATVVAAPTGVNNASSLWGAADAGLYYYYVTGINANGQSVGVTSAQITSVQGQAVTITIGKSVSGQETGYVIYRSNLNGSNVVNRTDKYLSSFREMIRIPASSVATTVYTDLNAEIPGSSNAFIMNMAKGSKAITWRQLLPMVKFPLYPTVSATVPWAQLLFGFLRIAKRRHHVVVKNIVPSSAVWTYNGAF